MTKNGRNKPSKQQNQKKQEKKQFSLKKKAETMRKNQKIRKNTAISTQKYAFPREKTLKTLKSNKFLFK